ncbi:MAG TPA: hypothetical protein VHY91_06240 [Pirellulales bacterium]|nr:hypothetical protein [Pirellulales bacterium]
MKTPHAASAVIEVVAGLALLSFPSATVALLLGTPLVDSASLTVARVGGAGLLTLGVACWLARGDTLSPTARGLIAAMLLYNVAAVALFAFAGLGPHGPALWPAVTLHALMAIWCIAWLRRGLPIDPIEKRQFTPAIPSSFSES